jgi:2',3'-cyclic-nucleotide 2'-phosphodiesterase (5'-nucleotidase family)
VVYLNKKFLFLKVSIIPLIVLALFGLLFSEEIFTDTEIAYVTIVHTNDIHGRVWEEESVAMGYAHIASIVEKIRKTNENVLLLDAGDTFQGSSAASLSRGEGIVKVMNSMDYDAMTAGNHDFGYGWQKLCELSEIANFPVLSANVRGYDGKNLLKSSIIIELSGIRIGIFGLTTPETMHKTHPRNVEGLIFDDPVQVAKKMVETLRDKCDLLIALVHLPLMGTEDSCTRLAEEVEEIDLIVSGHSHISLENGLEVNGTYIVQAGEYGGNLGIVNIVFKKRVPEEISILLYSPNWTEAELQIEESIQLVIDEINKENKKILSQVIGRTDVFLNGEREQVRTGETNLGKLVAEAMLVATGADAAIMNGGGIRTSIEVGEITRGDILNVLPFNNFVILKEIKGSDIVQALEHGISLYPEISGRYPQVAGIDFTFAPDKEPGNRIIEVTIAGQEVEPEKMYKIALNDFIAAGGDGYTMLEKGQVLRDYGALDNIVAEFIQKMRRVQL